MAAKVIDASAFGVGKLIADAVLNDAASNKKVSYYVNLGGKFNLHNVSSFSLTSGRDTTDYDGLGKGKFSVPESKNLREWEIECQLWQNDPKRYKNTWRASEIIKEIEAWMSQSYAIRMVKTDRYGSSTSLSLMVLITELSVKEEIEGIYDTTIKVKEYKEVGVKSTSIPYILRPGKIPISAKTIVTGSRNNAYSLTKKVDPKYANKELQRHANDISNNLTKAGNAINKVTDSIKGKVKINLNQGLYGTKKIEAYGFVEREKVPEAAAKALNSKISTSTKKTASAISGGISKYLKLKK